MSKAAEEKKEKIPGIVKNSIVDTVITGRGPIIKKNTGLIGNFSQMGRSWSFFAVSR